MIEIKVGSLILLCTLVGYVVAKLELRRKYKKESVKHQNRIYKEFYERMK